jgi:hypothetical protein
LESISNIFNACCIAFGTVFDGLKEGYKTAIKQAYIVALAVVMSLFVAAFGWILLVIIVEVFGIMKDKPKLQASYWIKLFGKFLLEEFTLVGIFYLRFCNLFSFIQRIFEVIFKPIIEPFKKGSKLLWRSIATVIISPILGICKGFWFELKKISERKRTFIVIFAIILLVGIIYYIFLHEHITEYINTYLADREKATQEFITMAQKAHNENLAKQREYELQQAADKMFSQKKR